MCCVEFECASNNVTDIHFGLFLCTHKIPTPKMLKLFSNQSDRMCKLLQKNVKKFFYTLLILLIINRNYQKQTTNLYFYFFFLFVSPVNQERKRMKKKFKTANTRRYRNYWECQNDKTKHTSLSKRAHNMRLNPSMRFKISTNAAYANLYVKNIAEKRENNASGVTTTTI